MPDYKKKRVSRIRSAPKRLKKSRIQKKNSAPLTDDIKMRPASRKKQTKTQDGMRVVKGNKLERRRKLKAFAVAAALIAVVLIVLELALPVGIGETLGNAVAVMGSGDYPIELNGTEVLDSVSKGAYYYVLTDNSVSAVSSGGKTIFLKPHGFENPILKTSSTRALVFDQGGDTALIYNLSKLKTTFESKNKIITAAISRCGVFAVVTRSESYASTVSVYDKNSALIYEWYSSSDLVNNVAISPNGKKIAVTTLNSDGGKYKSHLYVLTFDSANPVFSESFEDTVIYGIDSTQRGGFAIVTKNKFEFIKWGKYGRREYTNDYSISMLRAGSGGFAAVFNRENDRTDNRLAVFSTSGELKYEFSYSGVISDIEMSGGHIYCMSDNEVSILNNDGSVLRKADCGYGGVRMSVLGSYSVAVITDSGISKLDLKE